MQRQGALGKFGTSLQAATACDLNDLDRPLYSTQLKTMLALDDPYWHELEHAYGSASNIPGLLQALAKSPGVKSAGTGEPWHSLWSSLCHQGTVYSASYAAVPHIVEIASNASWPIDFSFFALPTAIEIGRFNKTGSDVPSNLRSSYEEAVHELAACALHHRAQEWDLDMTCSIASALAAAKGHHQLADALINLDEYWIEKINNRSDNKFD